jgi:hypothetical protein
MSNKLEIKLENLRTLESFKNWFAESFKEYFNVKEPNNEQLKIVLKHIYNVVSDSKVLEETKLNKSTWYIAIGNITDKL